MNIDPKLLKGVKYHDSEKKLAVKDGQKVYQYTPRERDLKPEDLLSKKEYSDSIVIVTADGQKIRIPKDEGREKKNSKG